MTHLEKSDMKTEGSWPTPLTVNVHHVAGLTLFFFHTDFRCNVFQVPVL